MAANCFFRSTNIILFLQPTSVHSAPRPSPFIIFLAAAIAFAAIAFAAFPPSRLGKSNSDD